MDEEKVVGAESVGVELPTFEIDTEVVLETPIIKPPTTPNNVKQEDSLLNKTKWTREDCNLMAKIVDNYIPKE